MARRGNEVRILLLGGYGQVGWELQRSLAPLGEIIVSRRESSVSPVGDLRDDNGIAATVRTVLPDVIVNAAAYTAVDRAESEPEIARQVNAIAPGVLAREAAASGAWLIHYSTDYVFDGSGDEARAEDAPTAPLNTYGRTKLEGEELIRRSGCRHLILRTSWVYAARGQNFARTILRLAAERDQLRVVADQFGAPTGAELLADVTAHAIRGAMVKPDVVGTYHVAASGETNWHEYARFVTEWARGRGRPVRVAAHHIEPTTASAYPTAAKRPANSRLNTTKVRAAFGVVLPHWKVGVERMLEELPAPSESPSIR